MNGVAGDPAVAHDTAREALHGDLRHFFPAEILQLLQLAQATGQLELIRPTERVELSIERGRPVFARTTGATVRVGDVLVHRGVVSRDAVELVAALQHDRPGQRVGTLLVSGGAASRAQVDDAVREVIKRVLYGVLLWREGAFRFVTAERLSGEEVKLDLDLDRLILEGLRLADEARAQR